MSLSGVIIGVMKSSSMILLETDESEGKTEVVEEEELDDTELGFNTLSRARFIPFKL